MPEWWGQSSRMSCNQRVERGWFMLSTNSKAYVFWHDIQLIFKQVKSRNAGSFLIKDNAFQHFRLKDQEDFCFVTHTLYFLVEKSRDNSQEVNWDVENKKRYTHISERKARSLQMGSPSTQGYWCQYRERSNVAPAIFSTNDMNGYKSPLLKIMWCSYVLRPYYRLQK